MEYLSYVVVGFLCCAGISRILEKIIDPVAEHLAYKEFRTETMLRAKKRRKELWKNDTIRQAIMFSLDNKERQGQVRYLNGGK